MHDWERSCVVTAIATVIVPSTMNLLQLNYRSRMARKFNLLQPVLKISNGCTASTSLRQKHVEINIILIFSQLLEQKWGSFIFKSAMF